ncbi:MAG: hypothetical protein JWO07_419 [Candidatus Saccharibacteria bacterium]|nr:hypothetical protein [Candidatus Saccharibacteria bacterium]
MLLVIALPPILSRITSNEWGVEYILLPLAIYVAYSIVLAALMRLGLRSYPALSTFILGLASLYLIVYRQDKINEFSQDLTRQNSLGLAAAITILIAIVIAVLVLEFKFRHKQTIEDTGSSAR